MHIELWGLTRIKPYDKNPQRNDDAVPAIAASRKEFDFRQPLVVDSEGVEPGILGYPDELPVPFDHIPLPATAPRLLITPSEAAFALSISTRKLWSLTNAGQIPCVRLGRAVRYSPADLQDWIQRQREVLR